MVHLPKSALQSFQNNKEACKCGGADDVNFGLASFKQHKMVFGIPNLSFHDLKSVRSAEIFPH